MFIDIAKIKVKAGNGGDGVVAFHREKYVAAGGPDGGDGGKGGDVIFVPDNHRSALNEFKYKRNYTAEDGNSGGRSNCTGKSGADLIIRLPKGTLVKDANTGRVVADISGDESIIIAKGGKGGWGNQHFATPTRQIPQFAKPGLPGETMELVLELKLLADVGLVGFPNVGKSTLISVVSEAKPKIANYPFTTLAPVLGVVAVGEEKSFVMADIPGLIEGASEGIGLGHAFLRHVDRCRLLVHVIDVSGMEDRDPIEDFDAICTELERFNPEMSTRPMLVAANKCDIATEEQTERFKQFIAQKKLEYFEISAATGKGTRELVFAIGKALETLPPIVRYEVELLPPMDLTQVNNRQFTVEIKSGEYFVEADWLDVILANVNMEDYESLQYFQRVLRTSGIIDKMEEMGIKEGDTVVLQNFVFDYIP